MHLLLIVSKIDCTWGECNNWPLLQLVGLALYAVGKTEGG